MIKEEGGAEDEEDLLYGDIGVRTQAVEPAVKREGAASDMAGTHAAKRPKTEGACLPRGTPPRRHVPLSQ